MSKKQTVNALQDAEVKHSINMNLTHDDIIDLAIQSQIEKLEPVLEAATNLRNEAKENIEKTRSEYIKSIIDKNINKHPKIKAFYALAKYNKSDEPVLKIHSNDTAGQRELLATDHFRYSPNWDGIHQYNKPLVEFKRRTEKKKEYEHVYENIGVSISADVSGFLLKTSENIMISMTESEFKTCLKIMKKAINEYAMAEDNLWELRLQMLELMYDEKKVKARVVKASLSKSKQGQSILDLLNEASTTKLLLS